MDREVQVSRWLLIVWSLIIAGCLAVAVLGLAGVAGVVDAHARRAGAAVVVQVLFVLWLVAATSSAVALTVPVFAAMLALALLALRRTLTAHDGGQVLQWLVRATLVIYAGWSTAAVFVNLATLVSGAGARTDGVLGTAWQVAFLVLAGVAALVILRPWSGHSWAWSSAP
jgi:hypothetical protein